MQHSGFIGKAACRGYRPRNLPSSREHHRPHLIARLAKDRTVARFVVAPSGYGKTRLVAQYADTMFRWQHVFWLNGKSPCFLRDLDDGDLVRECLATDGEVKLVVIEDLPQLDSRRVKRFSKEIDGFIKRGCEVVVTCVPSCDLLGGLQSDRVRMSPAELLLSDEEVNVARSAEDRTQRPASQVPPSCRVPALAWDPHPDAASDFVTKSLGEDIPTDLLLATCSVFVLQRGTLSDLEELGPIDRQLVDDVLVDYPHLGLNVEDGTFEAPDIDPGVIAHALKGRFESVAARSAFETRAGLALAWASCLLKSPAFAARACSVVSSLCPPKDRSVWLLENARRLVRAGCFYAAHRLIESIKPKFRIPKYDVLALEALCLRMLGDDEGAVGCAKRCGFEESASAKAQVVGLLLVGRLAKGALQEKAQVMLGKRAEEIDKRHEPLEWHDALVIAWRARMLGVAEFARTWARMRAVQADDDVLCLVASWLFESAGQSGGNCGSEGNAALAEAERFIRARLVEDASSSANFLALSAGLSLERAHAKGFEFFDGRLSSPTLLALRQAELAVLYQRSQYERERERERSQAVGNASLDLTSEKSLATSRVEQREVPLLEIWAFGRFDASIGGVPLPLQRLKRTPTRLLLILLAAYRGRDLTIDAIVSAMWPKQSRANGKKSFYTIWSELRRTLTLPDGTCPYLVRHQFGCRLDERYVRSDIARLDEICRELMFGRLDFDAWLDLYSEIDRDFAGELLPTETENSLIVATRDECRGRLVDALVAAALRLVDASSAQWAIWFARSAVDHDRIREDAYEALMRAQIASSQRTAAMMTYHTCRRVLAEELGIDPSPELTALYESLLE